MRPLGEAYAKAGYTVCGPRLKGHGTHYEEMEQTTYHDWIESVEEGYQRLKERCENIFVTGLSMGGTLTLHLAEKYSDIKAIIPINAAVEISEMAAVQNLEGIRFLDAIGSDIKNPDRKELAYEKTPVASVKEILSFMDLVKKNLSAIHCPTLLFVSPEDHVVPPANSKFIFDHISSEETDLIDMPDGCHFAPRCDYAQEMCRAGELGLRALNPEHSVRCVRAGELSP